MRGFFATVLLLITGGTHLTASAEGLCIGAESALFNCDLQNGTASLCESNNDGTLTYRNGTRSEINLEISDVGKCGEKVFYLSDASYAGGGEAHIRFQNGKYSYFLYDRTVKTEDGPEFIAGIAVYREDKKIANLLCKNDASIKQGAYLRINREKYKAIQEK